MKRPELLAPAGDMECLKCAVQAGCDAVYIGGKCFGARSFAANFNNEEIIEAVKYTHLYGVKLYVTVNTLIYENETEELINYIKFLHKNNVDAVIMQDIGMIDLVRKVLPNMDVHASTQLHIHNLSGVKLVESMGLTRVVLARETSIDDIKNIKNNSNIELEIFVHGALCISYSGQCLMSSLIGGRSGNRGSCAGSCRLQYDLVDNKNNKINKDKYLLSTKDLCSLENIGKLIDIGVDSFKIEGRMKRPIYVYMVVSLYRKAIDSYLKNGKVDITDKDIYELKKIFNREFTKGFLFNEDNNNIVNQYRPNHMGVPIGKVVNYNSGYVSVKLSDELNKGDGIRIIGDNEVGLTIVNLFRNKIKINQGNKNDIVSFKLDDNVDIGCEVVKTTDIEQLNRLNSLIELNNRKVFITGKIIIKNDSIMKLTISDGINEETIEFGNVMEARNSPITEEKIYEQLTKLGNTVYKFDKLDIELDDNVFVNIKDINEIRRKCILLLDSDRIGKSNYIENQYSIELPDYEKENNINIKTSNMEVIKYIKNNKYLYIDDNEVYQSLKNDNVIYMLPRVISTYPKYEELVQVEEFGGVKQYNKYMTGAFLNVTNSYSLALLHSFGSIKVTLSYELTYDRVEDIINAYELRYRKHPNVEVIVYGREEAMISKFNLLNKFNVSGEYYLRDRFMNKFPIRIKDNKMIIYNSSIRNYKENFFNIDVNNIRYDIDSKKELDSIKFTEKNQ